MTIAYSQEYRMEAMKYSSAFGNPGVLSIYTGTIPASCAAATTGTLLCDITTGSGYMSDDLADGGMTLTATLTGRCVASGTAGYFRIWQPGKTVCVAQGPIGATGLSLTDTTLVTGQTISLTQLDISAGNPAPGVGTRTVNAIDYSLASLQDILNKVDSFYGGSGLSLRFYTGSAPTTLEAAATGTLIGYYEFASEEIMGNPFTENPTLAETNLKVPIEFTASASGTIGYFRFYSEASPGKAYIQGTVGITGSGADLEMPGSAAVVAGQQVKLVSMKFSSEGLR